MVVTRLFLSTSSKPTPCKVRDLKGVFSLIKPFAMLFLSPSEAVKVSFKTKGLDNKPFEMQQLAKVIHHRRKGGWLKLQFKNGVISQYRVRRDDGFWHNWEKDKVYLKVEQLVTPSV